MAQHAPASHLAAETPSKRAARPIDLVHLAKQCLGDEHLEYEVLRLFDTTLATYFSRLQTADSADAIALNLHSIKGASSGVGAWAVADLAKSLETDIKAGNSLNSEHLHDLAMAIEETSAFIQDMLSKEPL